MELCAKQLHSVGMAVFWPWVLVCELLNHTSEKTLFINWKHSNTQGNSAITVRKTKVSFVDLGSFFQYSREFLMPIWNLWGFYEYFFPYLCYFKRSFLLPKLQNKSSASAALSKSCTEWCEPWATALCLYKHPSGRHFHLYFWFIVPETQSSGLFVAGIYVFFTWKANLCGSWVLPAFGSLIFWKKAAVVLGFSW